MSGDPSRPVQPPKRLHTPWGHTLAGGSPRAPSSAHSPPPPPFGRGVAVPAVCLCRAEWDLQQQQWQSEEDAKKQKDEFQEQLEEVRRELRVAHQEERKREIDTLKRCARPLGRGGGAQLLCEGGARGVRGGGAGKDKNGRTTAG